MSEILFFILGLSVGVFSALSLYAKLQERERLDWIALVSKWHATACAEKSKRLKLEKDSRRTEKEEDLADWWKRGGDA